MSAELDQQGRIWAVKDTSGRIFCTVETGLPTLYKTKKQAEAMRKRIQSYGTATSPVKVEAVEVKLVEVTP